jgi:FkbM family methyltransferase
MNFKALISNALLSYKLTSDWKNAFKRMIWLYELKNKLNRTFSSVSEIKFKYPLPIGEIKLKVRENNGSDKFIFGEVFDQKNYHLINKNEVKYIIDLGANAGYTALYYSKLFPLAKIACVEPYPSNVSILTDNLTINHVAFEVFEAAISTEDNLVEIEVSNNDYGHKVTEMGYGKRIGGKTIPVNGLSMNNLLRTLCWPAINILKIDIEGYEGVLFRKNTEWLQSVETIIMEIHENVSIDRIRDVTDKYHFDYALLRNGNWILSKFDIN